MAKHFKQTTRKTSTLIYIVLIALIIIAAILPLLNPHLFVPVTI